MLKKHFNTANPTNYVRAYDNDTLKNLREILKHLIFRSIAMPTKGGFLENDGKCGNIEYGIEWYCDSALPHYIATHDLHDRISGRNNNWITQHIEIHSKWWRKSTDEKVVVRDNDNFARDTIRVCSENFQSFDTTKFEFYGETGTKTVPHAGQLVAGIVKRNDKGQLYYSQWFICSMQFMKLWVGIMYGPEHPIIIAAKRDDDESVKSALFSRNTLCLNNNIVKENIARSHSFLPPLEKDEFDKAYVRVQCEYDARTTDRVHKYAMMFLMMVYGETPTHFNYPYNLKGPRVCDWIVPHGFFDELKQLYNLNDLRVPVYIPSEVFNRYDIILPRVHALIAEGNTVQSAFKTAEIEYMKGEIVVNTSKVDEPNNDSSQICPDTETDNQPASGTIDCENIARNKCDEEISAIDNLIRMIQNDDHKTKVIDVLRTDEYYRPNYITSDGNIKKKKKKTKTIIDSLNHEKTTTDSNSA